MSCPGALCEPLLGFEAEGFFLTPTTQLDPAEFCEEHEEILSMFCLDDLEPLCKLCATVSHAGHRVYLLSEAAIDCKEELRSALSGLKKKFTDFNNITQASHDVSKHNQAEGKHTELLIKDEFETLHQFLRQEEADRLLVLKEESKEKLRTAEEWKDKLDELITSLEEKILLAEKEIDSEGDGVGLLENYEDGNHCSCVGDMEPDDISLINVANHLANLRYTVWKKMKHITPYTPVTMDSRTAGRSLKISSEMNRVHVTTGRPTKGTVQIMGDTSAVPANLERFHPHSSILGRDGFNAGVHWWKVEVADNSNWTLGVASQWVLRRTVFEACPQAGLWCISLRDGEYRALTSSSQIFTIDNLHHLHRVGVRLDWEGGTVEFTNADTNAHLFTFNHCFAETVYPYFESILVGGNLTVSAQTVNVSIESNHPDCSNSVINGQEQEVKEDSSLGMDVNVVNGSSTAKKKLEIRSIKDEKTTVMTKKKTAQKNNTCAKRETNRKRFDVTYHVALNRALSLISINNSKQ